MRLFQSFFMGGFECADHINRSGRRINLLHETDHSKKIYSDYALLVEAGIKTVREGICWSDVEKSPFYYDFTEVKWRIDAATFYGIQQIWDLCHFGYPDDLSPTHPLFTDRFSSLCRAFATFYKSYSVSTLYVTPINEISFLSWHSGDMRGTVPFAVNSGFDIKYHLCKAAIKGIEALKNVMPQCRILIIEPLIRIHDNLYWSDPQRVHQMNEDQFQAMDIIGGYMCPELGGHPSNLDILGFNYYYNNQWIHNGPIVPWYEESETKTKLSVLLDIAFRRYQRPIVLSETGHFGEDRAKWIRYIADECTEALLNGVELEGICIYPVIDRPDWDDLSSYSNCGIWDLNYKKERIVDEHYHYTVKTCIAKMETLLPMFEVDRTLNLMRAM